MLQIAQRAMEIRNNNMFEQDVKEEDYLLKKYSRDGSACICVSAEIVNLFKTCFSFIFRTVLES